MPYTDWEAHKIVYYTAANPVKTQNPSKTKSATGIQTKIRFMLFKFRSRTDNVDNNFLIKVFFAINMHFFVLADVLPGSEQQ